MTTPTLRRKKKLRRFAIVTFIILLVTGLVLPEHLAIPVKGATSSDWNPETFWYEPWGASGVHKGIDIFAAVGTPAVAATYGLVTFAGKNTLGGNIVLILGPKWRLHYYAHLDTIAVSAGNWVSKGQLVGTVGNSGNAAGKQSHLHYVTVTAVPYPWLMDTSTQGWKKMFYLDVNQRLRKVAQ